MVVKENRKTVLAWCLVLPRAQTTILISSEKRLGNIHHNPVQILYITSIVWNIPIPSILSLRYEQILKVVMDMSSNMTLILNNFSLRFDLENQVLAIFALATL